MTLTGGESLKKSSIIEKGTSLADRQMNRFLDVSEAFAFDDAEEEDDEDDAAEEAVAGKEDL